VTYSGGTLVYAWTNSAAASASPPAQVVGVAINSAGADSVSLTWTAVSPTPESYTVQYRVSGTTGWTTAPSVTIPDCTVTGLIAATSYDFVVLAVSGGGVGTPSAILTATTSAVLSPPGQVTALAIASVTSSNLALTWSAPTSGGAVASYTVQYRLSGTTPWLVAASGVTATACTASGLSPATSYDCEILALNQAGTGPASSVVTGSTAASTNSVTAITWDLVPSGTYVHGSGVIGVNAHISPSTAPVQFGFSTSTSVSPATWAAASYVNTDLWGAYVNTPSVAGTWYAWVEGTDGSLPTVYPTGFTVS
jgi:hypothetical protein